MQELRYQQEFAQRGAESLVPGMELMDDCGRRLFIAPLDPATVAFNYVYLHMRSEFGFFPLESQREYYVPHYPVDSVPNLIALHYAAEHGKILRICAESGLPEGGSDCLTTSLDR